MNDHSDFPETIRARVHDGAIDRVTRFFNATLGDAFVELIQNSRRSGATRLHVVTDAVPDDTIRVTVTDNGDGIADPAVLLSFGESGWDEDAARREDPAGIGAYALSKRGCTVSSRARGPLLDLAPGWRVVLTPDCFLGKEEAAVVEADAPWPHGTAISFIAHEILPTIEGALAAAARHCPLPVTFNGAAIERTVRAVTSAASRPPSRALPAATAPAAPIEPASTRPDASTVCARTAPVTFIAALVTAPSMRALAAVISPLALTVPAARTARPTRRSPVTARSPPASRSVSTSSVPASRTPAPAMSWPFMSRSASIRFASAKPGIATR